MKKKLIAFLPLFAFIPSCSRYVPYVKDAIKQVDIKEEKKDENVESVVKSRVVRDELSWVGSFDALMLDDYVLKTYAKVYARDNGNPAGLRERTEKEELDKAAKQTVFYVLTPLIYKDMRLAINNTVKGWTPSLIIDGKGHKANKVEEVDLPKQYQKFFGKHLTRYKNTYQVTFDVGSGPLKRGETVELMFMSGKYSTKFEWKPKSQTLKKRAKATRR